ncbi:MAG TPA: Rieske 2Fe-2S domain-containing protein [Polyangia bacterium]|jgi:toluene monooxygenase system ferredoxin subunit|nr:Rieske 2Fe-2S domain-containing protein [Polyangia bacterium]
MALRRVAALDHLRPGEMKGVVVDGQPVVVLNVAGQVCAYADRCLHKGVPLSTGRLIDDVLLCDVHYWEYDSRTGCGINPSGVRLQKFRVAVDNDGIWVDASDEGVVDDDDPEGK